MQKDSNSNTHIIYPRRSLQRPRSVRIACEQSVDWHATISTAEPLHETFGCRTPRLLSQEADERSVDILLRIHALLKLAIAFAFIISAIQQYEADRQLDEVPLKNGRDVHRTFRKRRPESNGVS